MDKANAAPYKESTDTRQVDDVAVGLGGASRDIHHGNGTDGVGEQDSPDRNTSLVSPAEYLGSLAGLCHVKDSAGAEVDG